MKKLIHFIKKWFVRLLLRRRCIDLNDFKNCIKYTKLLEYMTHSDFRFSDYFEVHYENTKK